MDDEDEDRRESDGSPMHDQPKDWVPGTPQSGGMTTCGQCLPQPGAVKEIEDVRPAGLLSLDDLQRSLYLDHSGWVEDEQRLVIEVEQG